MESTPILTTYTEQQKDYVQSFGPWISLTVDEIKSSQLRTIWKRAHGAKAIWRVQTRQGHAYDCVVVLDDGLTYIASAIKDGHAFAYDSEGPDSIQHVQSALLTLYGAYGLPGGIDRWAQQH